MSAITRAMRQKAVYWGPPVDDGVGGYTFPDPVEIDCRWTVVSGEVTEARTHDVLSDSFLMVDRDVVVRGYLLLSLLADITPGVSPIDVDGAREIIGFMKIPNKRATEFLRKVTV